MISTFNGGLFNKLRFDRIDFASMKLGTWVVPSGSRLTTTLKTLETRKRTYAGTLKRDIRAQKHSHILEVPIQTGLEFDGLKRLKETRANVFLCYKDESGSGENKHMVSIGSLSYSRMKEYPSSMWIDKLRLTLEEV